MPKYIIIHHWGKEGQSFEGILSWFCASPKCETSAHYVVEAGRVACLVSPKDTAYHAGDWAYNEVSIVLSVVLKPVREIILRLQS